VNRTGYPSKRQKYIENDGKPVFVFVFGLSFTTFRYDHLVTTPADGDTGLYVTVDVTDTGDLEGDEVAQLHVREDVTSVETPRRSLKGFSRIHLMPQQTKTTPRSTHDLER
jgi:beta-glucosidase